MWNCEMDEAWAFENCRPSEECCACKSFKKCQQYHPNIKAVYDQRNVVRTIDVRSAEAFVAKACDIIESGASIKKRITAMYDLVALWYEYNGRDGYDRPQDS